MMHRVITATRPLTISEQPELDSENVTRPNYFLRRYGRMNVCEPRFAPLPNGSLGGMSSRSTGILTTESSDFSFREPHGRDLYGKFTSLFGGRIVLGPGKGFFFVNLIILVAILVLVVFEKDLIEKLGGGTIVFVTTSFLSLLSIVTFIFVGTTDPGVVSKSYTAHELMQDTQEYRNRHPNLRFHKYCNKCRAMRPPRTFHCSRCHVCIRQQDIHLFTAGTCIGERNRRAYFLTTAANSLLGIILLVANTMISTKLREEYKVTKHYSIEKATMVVLGTVVGLILLFSPQTGMLMFVYRLYLISTGRTAREEYRKYRFYDINDCILDHRSFLMNVFTFFFNRSTPSSYRHRLNRVDPESYPSEIASEWEVSRFFGRHIVNDPSLTNTGNLDANANPVNVNEINEALRLRELADFARGRSTPSVPLFEQDINTPTARIRVPRKSKPSCILQQKISAFQEARLLPKATVSYHRRHKLPLTLSEGCIPRTKDGLQEMIQLARAAQLRRIIQLILLRDRTGLIDMARRVNIAALVGMNRFDPDNLQLLELNNGLPMIAPRRRDVDQQGVNQQRLGAGVLGIPQMVAAGLLPTARDLANSVESMVGRGRIRRLPPVGRQRYVPITVVDLPSTRRPLNVNDVNLRSTLITPNNPIPYAVQRTNRHNRSSRRNLSPPPELITNSLRDDFITPIGLPQTPVIIQQQHPLNAQTRILDNDSDRYNNGLMGRNFFVGHSPRNNEYYLANDFGVNNTTINSTTNVTGATRNRMATPNVQNPPLVFGPFATHQPGQMVVIPVASDSD